ncbi:MAG: hypothetical protein M3327_14800, partial [Actinomycetota bacterium]|nr:hypothetical protein [Actinomycetota bacterium]
MRRVVSAIVPLSVALRRMRTRLLAVAVVVAALAAAAGLVGWSGIAAALSQEANVRLRLGEARSDDRSLQVVYHLRLAEGDARRRAVDAMFARLADVSEPPRRVSMLQSVGPSAVRLVAADDAERDVEVGRGRLPAGCQARVCEALALAGPFRIGEMIGLGRHLSARIVGRGAVRPAALPIGSETLTRTPVLTSAALLVHDLSRPLAAFARETGTTVATTAALDPTAVRGWELRPLSERLRVELVELERTGPLLETDAPFELLDELADRGDVARERLLLVAGQG